MTLAHMHLGKLFTHLKALLSEVELALSGSERDFEQAIMQVYEDRVYREIAKRQFRAPVASCQTIEALQSQLKAIAAKDGKRAPDLASYLQNIEWFSSSLTMSSK